VVVIVAFVAAAGELDFGALLRHTRAKLPDYMVPHRFEPIAAIPTTASGKADRDALPDPGEQAGV
jgi:acyl-coenzyme A synthetase/AMP-(fatty) acid ligase